MVSSSKSWSSNMATRNNCVCWQVMDFGYPQFTEAKILSEYINKDAHKMEVQHV